MSRATRIYLALNINGYPEYACTVKYEMKNWIALQLDLKYYSFYTIPDGKRCGNKTPVQAVNKEFFLEG